MPEPYKRILELRNGQTIRHRSRIFWTSIEGLYEHWTKLDQPVKYVRFVSSMTPPCFGPKSCRKFIEKMQWDDYNKGHLDITHNFLITGDGTLMEGRGWYFQSELPSEIAHLQNNCYDIAYMGNMSALAPSYAMINTAMNFIAFGIKQGYIKTCFEIIPYSKTKKRQQQKFLNI